MVNVDYEDLIRDPPRRFEGDDLFEIDDAQFVGEEEAKRREAVKLKEREVRKVRFCVDAKL